MNILLVGGVFNNEGGRASGYFAKLAEAIKDLYKDTADTLVINGGLIIQLAFMAGKMTDFDLVVWGADVPNDAEKIVTTLKRVNPNMMLVTTKNNVGSKYPRKLLAARALDAKANLLIEFKRDAVGSVIASIIDPLGNSFTEDELNIYALAGVLVDRLKFLASMTRVGSTQVGENPNIFAHSDEVESFLDLTRNYAETFHTLIHADDNGRMLGNISFRCESGFPTYRGGEVIYVSKRNVDKRDIGMSAMVPVMLSEGAVEYLGEAKPSVDTPIQRELYKAWPKANYMLHAHVYIEGAPFTENMIPCGAMQEVDEVLKVLPEYSGEAPAYINLIGHGSIAIAKDVAMLENIPYIARALV